MSNSQESTFTYDLHVARMNAQGLQPLTAEEYMYYCWLREEMNYKRSRLKRRVADQVSGDEIPLGGKLGKTIPRRPNT